MRLLLRGEPFKHLGITWSGVAGITCVYDPAVTTSFNVPGSLMMMIMMKMSRFITL